MDVFEYFNISNKESIYKYSPVYKTTIDGMDVVVKRTKKDINKLNKLFLWTERLNKNIDVVRPIVYKGNLYKTIDDENWVIYKFINGRNYSGSKEDIYQAGELLGKIHATSNNIFNHGFSFDNYDEDFISDVLNDINTLNEKYQDDHRIDSFKTLSESIKSILDNNFSDLKIDIPYIDCTWDYKANNLIYTDDSVVLIDPDNAGIVPRIFDLALALILFHNEIDVEPRIFNASEWEVFKKGYFKHITLTKEEIKVWNDFLLLVYLDEALWAMVDLDDDESNRQKEFIKSLLAFNPADYDLK